MPTSAPDAPAPPVTLAERVYAFISEENPDDQTPPFRGPLALYLAEQEPCDGAGLTRREDQLRDWGVAVGLAFGLRFATTPDDREAAADEALDAARGAFRRWAGDIPRRPEISPLIDRVIMAWTEADDTIQEAGYRLKDKRGPALVELSEALHDIAGALGTPEPVRRPE